jgi:hypothetical protein
MVYYLQGAFIYTHPYELHRMADAVCFLWFCGLRFGREEFIAQSHPPLKKLSVKVHGGRGVCRRRRRHFVGWPLAVTTTWIKSSEWRLLNLTG